MIGRDGGAEWARWIVEEREGGEMCWVGYGLLRLPLIRFFTFSYPTFDMLQTKSREDGVFARS